MADEIQDTAGATAPVEPTKSVPAPVSPAGPIVSQAPVVVKPTFYQPVAFKPKFKSREIVVKSITDFKQESANPFLLDEAKGLALRWIASLPATALEVDVSLQIGSDYQITVIVIPNHG